jgi:hypothetical protein
MITSDAQTVLTLDMLTTERLRHDPADHKQLVVGSASYHV